MVWPWFMIWLLLYAGWTIITSAASIEAKSNLRLTLVGGATSSRAVILGEHRTNVHLNASWPGLHECPKFLSLLVNEVDSAEIDVSGCARGWAPLTIHALFVGTHVAVLRTSTEETSLCFDLIAVNTSTPQLGSVGDNPSQCTGVQALPFRRRHVGASSAVVRNATDAGGGSTLHIRVGLLDAYSTKEVDGQRRIFLDMCRRLPELELLDDDGGRLARALHAAGMGAVAPVTFGFEVHYLTWALTPPELARTRLGPTVRSACGASRLVYLPAIELPLHAPNPPTVPAGISSIEELRLFAALRELGAARSFGSLPPWLRAANGIVETWHALSAFDVVVLGNRGISADAIVVHLARLAGVRVRLTELALLSPPAEAPVTAFVAPSHFVARHATVLDASGGAPVHVVHPAVAVSAEGSDASSESETSVCGSSLDAWLGEAATEHGKEGPPLVVGFVGRLSPEKAPGVLLRAAKLLLEPAAATRCARCVFVFVGDGRLRAHLETLAFAGVEGRTEDDGGGDGGDGGGGGAGLGLPERRVRFVGYVGDAGALSACVSRMHLLVSPSAYEETFGLAAVEALALGVPVVNLALGGMAEHSVHNTTAWVPRDATPAALAEAVARLAGDATLRARLGRRGARMVAEHLTPAAWALAYAKLVGALLAESGA